MKFLDKYKQKIRSQRLADCILMALLAFFDAVSPVWNFFFLKEPDPDETTSKFSKVVNKVH